MTVIVVGKVNLSEKFDCLKEIAKYHFQPVEPFEKMDFVTGLQKLEAVVIEILKHNQFERYYKRYVRMKNRRRRLAGRELIINDESIKKWKLYKDSVRRRFVAYTPKAWQEVVNHRLDWEMRVVRNALRENRDPKTALDFEYES